MSPSLNITTQLAALAQSQPETPAVVIQHWKGDKAEYETLTFRALHERSDRLAHALTAHGLTRGLRTVLMVKPSADFFALTFAMFKAGIPPVMVDPGMGTRNLKQCLDESKPEAFIGIAKAQFARFLFGWAKGTLKFNIAVGGGPLNFGATKLEALEAAASNEPFEIADTQPDEVAAVLFTSGSTGVPKGVVYTHGIFDAQVRSIRGTYGIEPGERDVATFPLFALFGPALGMSAIIPDMDATRPGQAEPRRIVACINDHQATNMFGSPALISNLGAWGRGQGARLPSLRRVISAGAPALTEALRDMSEMLEQGVEIYTPYGATEAMPVASIGSVEILTETGAKTDRGHGTCLGRPVAGMDVRIIRISDEPIGQWSHELEVGCPEVGEIVVRGPVVTREYFERPEPTALAKIPDGEGGVWHRMGDLGYYDEKGRVWFCGRKSHRVETETRPYYTIPVERIFNTHYAVRRTALVGVELNGELRPVVCIELLPEHRHFKEMASHALLELAPRSPITRGIQHFLVHPGFPVDVRHNSKIFREKLAVWAAEQLA